MANKIGVVLALDNEREFTQGMKNAKDSVKYLDDGLKDLKTEFSDSANSMDALAKKQDLLKQKQEAYDRVLKAAKSGQTEAKKTYKDQAKALEALKKELDEAKASLDKMEKAGDTSSKAYKDQKAAVDTLTTAVSKQTANYLKAEGRLSKWDHEVAQAEKAVKNNSKAVEKNAKYIDEAKKSADGCATSIDKYGKEVKEAGEETKKSADQAKDASQVYTSFGEKLGTAIAAKGVQLATSAVQALGQKIKEAAKYVVEVGSKFESSMSKVKALSGASGAEFDALSEKAQALGGSTQYSASEVADAFGYMSLAGWDTQSMLEGIDGVLNLATASQMDLAQASDMVTDYLSAFGLAASDAGHMADMMAYAQANSNTSTTQLGDAFGNCAANMHAAGQSMETTTAILEAMANQGTKGSEAGTALSAVMRDIGQKSKNGAIQIGKSSVQVQDAAGNYRSLTDILKDVETATQGMGTAEKDAALRATFTKNSIKAVNEVLTEGVGKVQSYETSLSTADGTASTMATTMTDNLGGAITEASSAAEGLGIALYKQISGPMTNAIRGVSGVLNMITTAITPHKTELETFLDEVIETDEKINAMLDAAQQDVNNAEGEVNKLDAYKNTILELQAIINSGGKLDAFQLYQMKNAVEAVSGEVPTIGAHFDEVTGKISLTTAGIERAFEVAKQGIMEQAVTKALSDSMEAWAEAKINEAKAVSAATAAQEEYDKFLKTIPNGDSIVEYSAAWYEMRRRMPNFNKLCVDVVNANKAVDTAADTTKRAEDEYNNLYDTLTNVNEETENYKENTDESYKKSRIFASDQKEAAEALDGVASSAEDAGDAVEDAGEAEKEAARKAEEAAKAIAKAHDDAAKEIESAYEATKKEVESAWNISPFQGWEQNEEEGLSKFMESLQSQIDGITNYKSNLAILRAGLTDENGKMSEENARFLSYVEGLGTSGAQLVQDLASSINSGDPSQLTNAVQRYIDAMHVESDIESVLTADQMAVKLGLKELGSSAEEWEGLSSVANKIMASGDGVAESTKAAFVAAASIAKRLGVKIPEGLADGIEAGEDDPTGAITQATALLTAAISGQGNALITAAKNMGIDVPEEVAAGIDAGGQSAVDAYDKLVGLVAAMNVDTSGVTENIEAIPEAAKTAIESGETEVQTAAEGLGDAAETVTADTATATAAGTSFATAYAGGITAGQTLAQASAQQMANASAQAANNVSNTFRSAGQISGSSYAAGIRAQAGSARSAASSLASSARSGASGVSFYSVGSNIASGVASGIRGNQSSAISAAVAMARAALRAAKNELGIKSPSKVFREQVGKQVANGMAFGIKQGTSTVVKEMENLSKNTYSAAVKWLSQYKGAHATTWQDEEYFWDKMTNVAKRGTAAYAQVIANWTALNVNNAFGVSRTETDSSGKTVTKDAEDYYNEILRAAEQFQIKLAAKDNVSIREQMDYWKKVRNLMDSNSEAYWDIVQKQLELNEQIGNMDIAEDILEKYRTYYDMSEQAVVDYWDKVRKKYTAGTEDRIRADQNYLNAKKDLDDKLAEIEENYADKIDDANQRYLDALDERKQAIMEAFGLFDEFESSSESGEKLLFNMQSQAAGYEEWSKTLDDLQKRGIFSDELMRILTDKGPADIAALKALLMLTDEQLKAYQEAYDRKEAAALRQAEEDTADIKKSVESEIADLKAAEAKELEAVKEHISSDLTQLANNVRSIAEDQTAALVGAFNNVATKLADSTGSSVSDRTLYDVDVNRNGTQRAVAAAQEVKAAAQPKPTTTTKTTTTTTTTSGPRYKVKASNGLNMRADAGTGAKILTTIKNGSEVVGTGKTKKSGGVTWYEVKYGNQTGWVSGQYIQKLASGIFSALKGLALTDEEGLGSEAILTKQGVLRQLDAGDTVFNAAQRRNLWEISKLNMPDVASMAALNQRLVEGYSAQVRASSATNDTINSMAALMAQFLPYLAQSNQVYLDGRALVSGTADGMSQSLAMRARRKR